MPGVSGLISNWLRFLFLVEISCPFLILLTTHKALPCLISQAEYTDSRWFISLQGPSSGDIRFISRQAKAVGSTNGRIPSFSRSQLASILNPAAPLLINTLCLAGKASNWASDSSSAPTIPPHAHEPRAAQFRCFGTRVLANLLATSSDSDSGSLTLSIITTRNVYRRSERS